MSQNSGPPPAWYDDPDGSGRQRWWDGKQWGPVAPAQTSVAAPIGGATSTFAPPASASTTEGGAPSWGHVGSTSGLGAQHAAPAPGGDGESSSGKGSATPYLVISIAALLLCRVPLVGVLLSLTMVAFGVILLARGARGKKIVVGLVIATLATILSFGGGDDAEDEEAAVPPAATQAVPSADTTPAVGEPAPAPAQTKTPAADPAPEEPAPADDSAKYGTYPEAEKMFVATVLAQADQYGQVETDLQRSEVVRTRDAAICAAVGGTATDWVGVISDIGANGEGKAWVEIELAPNVRVQTWNNALSDSWDNTLIDPSASMFNGLVAMTKGQRVVFSGDFVGDDSSCVKTANVTEVFGATDPKFVFRFSDVHAQ